MKAQRQNDTLAVTALWPEPGFEWVVSAKPGWRRN